MTLKSNFSVECGLESEANPQYNYETNNAFGSAVDPSIPALERNFPMGEAAIPTWWTNELMSDEDTKAVFETTHLIGILQIQIQFIGLQVDL